MYIDIRWVFLLVVVGGAIVAVALQPSWIAPITVGITVAGVLYVLLQLGDRKRPAVFVRPTARSRDDDGDHRQPNSSGR